MAVAAGLGRNGPRVIGGCVPAFPCCPAGGGGVLQGLQVSRLLPGCLGTFTPVLTSGSCKQRWGGSAGGTRVCLCPPWCSEPPSSPGCPPIGVSVGSQLASCRAVLARWAGAQADLGPTPPCSPPNLSCLFLSEGKRRHFIPSHTWFPGAGPQSPIPQSREAPCSRQRSSVFE